METGEALSSPLETALATVTGREEGTPVTTAEVADDLDCQVDEARARLDRLADRGRLATRQVGGVHVWWRPPGATDDPPGDGTADERADAALREERAFANGVLDNQRDVVYAFGVDGGLRRWNDRLRIVTGYTDAEIEEMEPLSFVAPRAADRVEAAMARVLDDREPDTVEAPLVTADGTEIPYEFSGAPMTDDGTVVGLTGIGRDVSDRRARRRELRQERDLVERIFEASPVAIALFDADGDLRRANARAEDVLVADGGEYTAGDLLDAEGRPLPFEETPIGRTLATGQPVTDVEVQYAGPDGDRRWLSVTTRLLDGDGDPGPVLVTAEDVTRLKEQARELRRRREDLESELATVLNRVDDAFYALDDELRFTYVNDRAEELLGHAEADLLGRNVWEALDVAPDDPLRDRFETAMATQEPTSFERESEPLGIWEVVRLYPSESGLSVYFTDVTERKVRERELEESRRRYRTLVENFPNGAVALVDEQLRYVTIGGTPLEGVDATAGDLKGNHVREVLPPALADLLVPRYAAALDGNASTFEGAVGDRTYQFRVLPVRNDDGEVVAAMGMSQDVTEQKAREQTLREAKLQLEAATEAGTVGIWEWHVQEDRFVAGATFARQFDVDPDAAREGVSLDRFVSAIHEDDRERVERKIDEAVASCGDYEAEYRVRNADGEYRWVVARGHVDCDDDGDPVTFPGALVDITERKHAEQELQRHRERLAVLNGLNAVVREVTDAVVERSTRAEIERATCEALAAADSYEFAWIGSVDPATGTVTVDAEAGIDGYLDDLALSITPDGPGSHSPTARAVRTRELQVSRDVHTDPDYEPWHGHAREHGYRSSAAIPIVHEGSLYGVLNVYSARPRAFDEAEREVVGGLGEVVGHAIAAVERKHALAGDEVVEVSFHAHDVLETIGLSDPPPGRVSFDYAVAVDDGGSVDFGTVDADARPLLEALVAGTDRFDDLTVLGEDGGTLRFQLRLSGPSVLLAVASLGGYVERAVLADGDFRLTVLLPPSVDVQTVADAVTTLYPSAELVRRRTRVRRGDGAAVTPLQRVLHDELTDRQRTVLETAFHAGYFESPRHATAEELAAALDISSPTLSHHLRRAEKTVLASIFGDSVQDPG